MKAKSVVGQDECVAAIQAHFTECRREPKAEMCEKNDRSLFNIFRLAYTRLPHSKRERRHFVHYIIKINVWHRIERRYRNVRDA
jgi:hypothetical protein